MIHLTREVYGFLTKTNSIIIGFEYSCRATYKTFMIDMVLPRIFKWGLNFFMYSFHWGHIEF